VSYLVLARKWRPQTFQDLVGQEHVARTLQNAIASDRVAHAFLFTGARGVGKTSAARIFAKALNCLDGPSAEPCNRCTVCTEITDGRSVDVLEIDGASNNGVEQVRELREDIKYLPAVARYKIIIIDEVHMLSTSAFNALLKTLEEPPPHVKFIFATTEPHKVPITILSRCQRFDFRRIPLARLVERLRSIVDHEGVTISDEALTTVARKGDGSMRDSLSTLDQVLAYCGTTVTDDDVVTLLGVVDRRLVIGLVDALIAHDPTAALKTVTAVDSYGYSQREFAREILHHLRNVFLRKAAGPDLEPGELSDTELESIARHAEALELSDVERMLAILLKAESDMGHATFPRYVLELAVVRMASLVPLLPAEQILEMLREEKGKPSPATQPSLPRPVRTPSPPTPAPPRAAPAAPPPPPPQPLGDQDPAQLWEAIVTRIREHKPLLATALEKARPLRVDRERIEFALPPKSGEFELLRDTERIRQIQAIVDPYLGTTPVITVRELHDDLQSPPSLEEKKTLDQKARERQLREQGLSHPLVREIITRFSAELSGIHPIDT